MTRVGPAGTVACREMASPRVRTPPKYTYTLSSPPTLSSGAPWRIVQSVSACAHAPLQTRCPQPDQSTQTFKTHLTHFTYRSYIVCDFITSQATNFGCFLVLHAPNIMKYLWFNYPQRAPPCRLLTNFRQYFSRSTFQRGAVWLLLCTKNVKTASKTALHRLLTENGTAYVQKRFVCPCRALKGKCQRCRSWLYEFNIVKN